MAIVGAEGDVGWGGVEGLEEGIVREGNIVGRRRDLDRPVGKALQVRGEACRPGRAYGDVAGARRSTGDPKPVEIESRRQDDLSIRDARAHRFGSEAD